MWVVDGITGKLASAKMRFSIAAPACCASRSAEDCLRCRTLASAALPLMPSVTHIVPLLVGCPVKAKRISDILLAEYGLYVQPINYPTVPKGTERLRFTPSPLHDDAMMDTLVSAMDALWSRCNVARRPAAA